MVHGILVLLDHRFDINITEEQEILYERWDWQGVEGRTLKSLWIMMQDQDKHLDCLSN